MKRNLLSRLRTNGIFYLIGAFIILMGIPLYQVFILGPTNFDHALNEIGAGHYVAYLFWIHEHTPLFILYRLILLLAFALLISLPFSLYRIIVAQEIMYQQEIAEQEGEKEEEEGEEEKEKEEETVREEPQAATPPGMPPFAWRGKGFAIIAIWIGLAGIALFLLTTIISTIYFAFASSNYDPVMESSGMISAWNNTLSIASNSVGMGMLGLSTLFFGALICRTGLNLWPPAWVVFGYIGIATGGLLCINAVGVACSPGSGQSPLNTIATLLLGLWSAYLGILLVRLRPANTATENSEVREQTK